MSDLEFKATIIRILPKFENSIEDTRESLTTELKDLKSSQVEKKCYNRDAKWTDYNDHTDGVSRGINT